MLAKLEDFINVADGSKIADCLVVIAEKLGISVNFGRPTDPVKLSPK
jgi:hypothetical protein